MTTVTPYGMYPGATSYTFTPDSLIAGDHPRITKNVVIAANQQLNRGAVLGQQSLGTPTGAAGSNTGNGTIGTLANGAAALPGAYLLTATSATNFTVTDPKGTSMPPATVGANYSDAKLAFKITAGGTPFVAGDTFTVTVPNGSGSYVLSAAAATDGSQTPSAILVDGVDTTGGALAAAIYESGEFNVNALIFGTGWTAVTAEAPLRAVSIYLKTPVAGDPV
jgi:hypothetical protein